MEKICSLNWRALVFAATFLLTWAPDVRGSSAPQILGAEPDFGSNSLLITGANLGSGTFTGTVSLYVPSQGTVNLTVLSFDGTRQEIVASLPTALASFPGTYLLSLTTGSGTANFAVGAAGVSDAIPWSNVSKTGASLADLPTRNFTDLQNRPTTVSGYNITDAVTSSGAQTISNKTIDSPDLTGTVTLQAGSTLYMDPGSSFTYAPLQWSGGSGYAIGGALSTFQSVADNDGSFEYNHLQAVPGDVNFGIQLESRYQNVPQGVDSEYYYFWNSPDYTAQRRIYQANVSWGPAYGAPASKPAGWARFGFDVNWFGIGKGNPFADNFCIRLDGNPHTLTFDGNATFGAGLAVGTTSPNPMITVLPTSGDTAIQLTRNYAASEYLRIGAAGGGTLFGGTTNYYPMDIVGPSAPYLRPIIIRRSLNSGATFTPFVEFDPVNGAMAVGNNATSANLAGISLFVGGPMNVNGGTNVSRIMHGTVTLSAGKAAVSVAAVTKNSRIFLTIQSPGGVVGTTYVSSRSPGSSFSIASTSGTDSSLVAWLLVEP